MPEPDCFLRYHMRCNTEFYDVGKISHIGIGSRLLQWCMVLKWFYLPREQLCRRYVLSNECPSTCEFDWQVRQLLLTGTNQYLDLEGLVMLPLFLTYLTDRNCSVLFFCDSFVCTHTHTHIWAVFTGELGLVGLGLHVIFVCFFSYFSYLKPVCLLFVNL